MRSISVASGLFNRKLTRPPDERGCISVIAVSKVVTLIVIILAKVVNCLELILLYRLFCVSAGKKGGWDSPSLYVGCGYMSGTYGSGEPPVYYTIVIDLDNLS